MAKEKKSGLPKMGVLGDKKPSPVQSFASAPTPEPVEKKRVTFSNQMDPDLKQKLKVKSGEYDMKVYEIIEEALEEYFERRDSLKK